MSKMHVSTGAELFMLIDFPGLVSLIASGDGICDHLIDRLPDLLMWSVECCV